MEEINAVSEMEETSDLMTPEEMAMLKKLQAKRKSQQKAMGATKQTLFEELTTLFGDQIKSIKKEVRTISTKVPRPDGNIYAISFGSDEDTDADVDTVTLANDILDHNPDVVASIMGISNSIKVSGSYEGQKLFWQIRKRENK